MDGLQGEPFVRVRIPFAGQQQHTNNPQALRFRGGRGAAPTRRPLIDQLMENTTLQHHAEILRGLKQSLEEEKKDFLHLQEDVFRSFAEHELMEASFDRQFEAKQDLSGRLADRVAEIGGSWKFLSCFGSFIFIWCVINFFHDAAWDPYPFILLNLCLSCLAAFQAPVIMMSQNRQVERDRGMSDYTARVNLRAELITRHINCKLDALISSAWKRLFESQALSTSILERLLETEQQRMEWRKKENHQAHVRARRNSKGILEELGEDEAPPSPVPRRPSQEVIEAVLRPGAQLQVYDDIGEGERMSGVVLQEGGVEEQKQEEGRKPDTAVTTSSTSSSSSSLAATGSSLYTTPLAALSLAPPAAPALVASELPWLLETEEDEHTLYLMRTMLKAKGASPQQLQQQQYDEECMVFEHRSSNLGDNFIGVVSHVRLESRDPSLATKGVVCCCGPVGTQRATTTTTTSTIPQRGRPVTASFVSAAVETASLVDTGGGAEPWFPFDLCYDLRFTEGAVLDSILAGDALLTLRNALDLPCMTAEGEIITMVLHPRGCPCSLLEAEAQHQQQHQQQQQQQQQLQPGGGGNGLGGGGGGGPEDTFLKLRSACPQAVYVSQGEVPPRFKPCLSKDREDRISQFWKKPLGRVTISYNPAPIFACVTLRAGQMSVPRSVEFLSHHHAHVANASTTHSTAAAAAAATVTANTSTTATGTTTTTAAGGMSTATSGGTASEGGGFMTPPLKKTSSGGARTMASLLGLPPPGGNSSSTNTNNSGFSLLPSSSSSSSFSTSDSIASSLPSAVPASPPVVTSSPSSSGDRALLTHQLSGSMSLQKIFAMNRASLPERWQTLMKQEASEPGPGEARASSGRPPKQLYCIINPSAELLCNALAWGFVQASEERTKGADGRGDAGVSSSSSNSSSSSASSSSTSSSSAATHSSNTTNKEVPLRLGPQWEGTLPHNQWLQLHLRKNAGRYEIDLMVPIVGPAAVFFYSPQGRLRLRGFLRDDGSA